MTYQEALTFIHSLDRFGSRPGLDRVRRLFDKAPEILDQRFIHIAGTNGKGSVSAMLSFILREAGYRVGTFISPFIVDFRERIQIDNEMIGEDELADAVAFFKPYTEELNRDGIVITEFEFITAVGFYLFKQRGCDVVVCEVGMGGLYDSTNLIPCPLCSVITRIALDHTEYLGDTISEIAVQKCGIIKRGSCVATAAQEADAMRVIRDTAEALDNPLYLGDCLTLHDIRDGLDGVRFCRHDIPMRLNLVGKHQIENLRCALAAIDALCERPGLAVTDAHIREGLAKVRHPARFEILRRHPLVILDGAHNPNGLSAFANAVGAYAAGRNKTLIIGMLADKDDSGLAFLKGLFTRVIATNVRNPRALRAEALAEKLRAVSDSVEVAETPLQAYRRACSFGDDVFICGSLYLASEIRPIILEE